MYDLVDSIALHLPTYMLVFVRLTAMMTVLPIFGYATVQPRMRGLIALSLTFIVAPGLPLLPLSVLDSLIGLLVLIAREVFTGIIIGFGARMIFEALAMAGSYVSMQIGLAMVNIFDPSMESQQPMIASFWMLVLTLIFLSTDSHFFLVETLYHNFSLIGLGQAAFPVTLGEVVVDGSSLIFDIALRFAAPALVFMIVMEVAMAFMARMMPQMNVFFVAMPLKIGVGLVVLILSLDMFQVMFGYLYGEMEHIVEQTIMNLR
ncbi:MAG TPA: flagellar biosynthetic protein FliR [Calditrichia bacterium]|nr:flagellar biosynthetic protein FliR [Calditrichota bacterium]HQU70657.1 flagellar biosynthetic protein FliR [Calditrichia bacterium]HQV30399.1 flagellar biosynthetic protein FliR [Calditrichia bacterium]